MEKKRKLSPSRKGIHVPAKRHLKKRRQKNCWMRLTKNSKGKAMKAIRTWPNRRFSRSPFKKRRGYKERGTKSFGVMLRQQRGNRGKKREQCARRWPLHSPLRYSRLHHGGKSHPDERGGAIMEGISSLRRHKQIKGRWEKGGAGSVRKNHISCAMITEEGKKTKWFAALGDKRRERTSTEHRCIRAKMA